MAKSIFCIRGASCKLTNSLKVCVPWKIKRLVLARRCEMAGWGRAKRFFALLRWPFLRGKELPRRSLSSRHNPCWCRPFAASSRSASRIYQPSRGNVAVSVPAAPASRTNSTGPSPDTTCCPSPSSRPDADHEIIVAEVDLPGLCCVDLGRPFGTRSGFNIAKLVGLPIFRGIAGVHVDRDLLPLFAHKDQIGRVAAAARPADKLTVRGYVRQSPG